MITNRIVVFFSARIIETFCYQKRSLENHHRLEEGEGEELTRVLTNNNLHREKNQQS